MDKKKIELLAPAGDFEKLKFAINYGADAVYIGDKNFSLRANSKNFDYEELNLAIKYAHENNVKVYVAINIFARYKDLIELKKNLYVFKNADALIVSDPGIFLMVKEILPDMEIHVSTQANVLNYKTVEFWKKLGVNRIILARELSCEEIKFIAEKNIDIELEAFVHGAMCISYSGRCLLSNFFTGRDANHGDCAQACRWKYKLYALEEEKRKNKFWPIWEDDNGSFILNSKDICMVNYLDKLFDCGIKSLKIEGRMKSIYYVAAVTKIYREAIDDYFLDKKIYDEKKNYYLSELEKVSHRIYSSGFYLGDKKNEIYESSSYINNYDFVGIVKDFDEKNFFALVEQRNKIKIGDEIEILGKKEIFYMKVKEMFDNGGNEIKEAPHAQQIIKIKMDFKIEKMDLMRRKIVC